MWYLIYLLLITICLFGVLKLKKSKKIYRIFLLITILFVGLRENIGIDYYIDSIIFNTETKIKGYLVYLISFILRKFNLKFYTFTLSFGILNTYFFNLILNKNFMMKKNKVKGWFIYILDYGYISSFNVMRQGVANLLFLLSIGENSWIKIGIFFFIGLGFHKSIILLIPLFLIAKIKFSTKSFKILFFIVIVFSTVINFQNIFIEYIFPYLGYYSKIYMQKELFHFVSKSESFGVGRAIRVILCLTLIFFYDELLKKDNKKKIYLNLSIFWGLLTILTYKIFIISRILEYLYISTVISYPLMIEYLKTKKYGKYLIIIFWLILLSFYLKSTIFSDSSQKLMPYKNFLF